MKLCANVFVGWVPLAVIRKGEKARKVLPIHVPTPPAPIPINPATETPSANCLQETLRRFWDTIFNNQTVIEQGVAGLSEYAQSVLFAQYSPAYADMIYDSESTHLVLHVLPTNFPKVWCLKFEPRWQAETLALQTLPDYPE